MCSVLNKSVQLFSTGICQFLFLSFLGVF
jgi:hypothetical protein